MTQYLYQTQPIHLYSGIILLLCLMPYSPAISALCRFHPSTNTLHISNYKDNRCLKHAYKHWIFFCTNVLANSLAIENWRRRQQVSTKITDSAKPSSVASKRTVRQWRTSAGGNDDWRWFGSGLGTETIETEFCSSRDPPFLKLHWASRGPPQQSSGDEWTW